MDEERSKKSLLNLLIFKEKIILSLMNEQKQKHKSF